MIKDKEQIVTEIKERIAEERRKYKNSRVDWIEVAARKVYAIIKDSKESSLEQSYENIINDYIKEFENRVEFKFDYWIAERIGEIACFGDYYFDFRDVKFVIDNDIILDYLIDWYYFTIDFQECKINLENYCMLRSEKQSQENFNLDNFEKWLIYMRYKNSN